MSEAYTWLKFKLRTSTAWLSLPLMTRGLGDELLRYVDPRTGVIELPGGNLEEKIEALWRVTAAHPKERRTATKHLERLLERGTIAEHGEGIWFPRFAEHQGRPADGPTLSARSAHENDIQRALSGQKEATENALSAGKDGSECPGRALSASSDRDMSAKSLDPDSTEKRREEERREEKRRDPTLDSFKEPRDDVQELHTLWKRTFGYHGHKLGGVTTAEYRMLADAIEREGLAHCLLVTKHAPQDGMVTGKQDDRGRKHDSIRYLFDNRDAFHRILRDAQKREGKGHGRRSLAEIHEEARNR